MLRAHDRGSAARAKGMEPAVKSKQRPLYAGMKAMIVEDDCETSRLCRRCLEEHGLEVKEINRGVAAIAEVRKERPDLILIGLQLRDVSGLEAVGWLKADPAFCLVPVVALSAGALPADDPMLRRSGVDAVLRKPVSAENLARAIRLLLG